MSPVYLVYSLSYQYIKIPPLPHERCHCHVQVWILCMRCGSLRVLHSIIALPEDLRPCSFHLLEPLLQLWGHWCCCSPHKAVTWGVYIHCHSIVLLFSHHNEQVGPH